MNTKRLNVRLLPAVLLLMVMTFVLPVQAQVTVGSALIPNAGSLLDVKTSNNEINATGGINVPRVLISNFTPATDAAFAASIGGTGEWDRQKHVGLIVYNVGTPAGLYGWDGTKWVRYITELPKTGINIMNLQTSTASADGAASGTGGSELDFGTLTIPEDGAFAFSFRLYGTIADITFENQRCIYYLGVYGDGGVLKDIAEINIYAYINTGYRYTYSVTLGAEFTAGENVTFKLIRYSGSASAGGQWTLVANPAGTSAARTSMVWWKL